MNETNKEITTTTPPHFWISDLLWRTTNTGISQNVISTYAPYKSKKSIIAHMRENITPYSDGRKYIPRKERKYNPYFTDIINDCMKDVWKGDKGFVFNENQLKEVMKIFPSVDVEWSKYSGGYYYCK